jgi:hypothetical protein
MYILLFFIGIAILSFVSYKNWYITKMTKKANQTKKARRIAAWEREGKFIND